VNAEVDDKLCTREYNAGVQHMTTPKAFANSSPGLERQRQPWDRKFIKALEPWKGSAGGKPFQGSFAFLFTTQGSHSARTLGWN